MTTEVPTPEFTVTWLPRVASNGHGAHPGETDPTPHLGQRFVPGGTFILDLPDDIPAIWGLGQEIAWAEGESLMINGPNGVGKTTLTAQLVRARLGLQDSVLGYPVTPGAKKVLYLAMDRPRQIARANRRLYTELERGVMDERLVFHQGPPPTDLAKDTTTLAAMALAAGADTIVVDSLKDAALKLSEDETGGAYNRARQRALVEGVQVLELHHQRKSSGTNAKPNNIDDVYGSVWLTAGAGSVICLWGTAGDAIVELSHLKQPAEPVGPMRIIHDHNAGTSERWNPTDMVATAIANRGRLTARLAAMVMFETETPAKNNVEAARRKLDGLVKNGKLHRTEGARGGGSERTEATYQYVDPKADGDPQ